MKKSGFTHESAKNESKEWYTPPEVFQAIGLTYDMDTASPGAAVVPWIPAEVHLTKVEDGLKTKWWGRVFTNPPYGKDTPAWVKKFVEHHHGVMLVFARVDTTWFHDYAVKSDCIVFMRGRIKFLRPDGTPGGSAGAGSMLLGCGLDCVDALKKSKLGYFVRNAGVLGTFGRPI